MINITNKKDCCGCNACLDACPEKAISLKTDVDGFWYPEVDSSRCTKCGLCEYVCPVQHAAELKKNEFEKSVCFAAAHKNIETRFDSTSGGLFSALAEQMYREGGYVGGAVYRDGWSVTHLISNNPEDLQRLRQCKYSQSDTSGFFTEVKKLLVAGEKVLVCGTPCQMAGLRQFLCKDYDNLIVVDFICNGVISPKYYAKYLDYWERKTKSKLVRIMFKNKEFGWKNPKVRIDFANGKSLYSGILENDLINLPFYEEIISRQSCIDCQFKDFPRTADITLADFIGCEKFPQYKSFDDDVGTSAVIVNNQHGLDFFKKIESKIQVVSSRMEDVFLGNTSLMRKYAISNIDRNSFYKDLDTTFVEKVVPKYFNLTFNKLSLKQKIKRFLKIAYHAISYTQARPSVLLKFIYLNVFCKHVKTDWLKEGVIYPTPYTIIELQKGSLIELHGPLVVGAKTIKKSKLETRLLLQENAKMTVNQDSSFGYGSDVEVLKNAHLSMDHCGTNNGCTIICGKRIEMQGRVSLGRNVDIRDTNAHVIAIEGYKILRPVHIEDHVWLCSNVHVCPGVKIKAGAVVAANSTVMHNVPAHSLAYGNPAKVIHQNIAWKL